MHELMEELTAASRALSSSLSRYLGACTAIQNYYAQTTVAGIPPALSEHVQWELASACFYETNIQRAKSIISRARNCSAAVAPIHSLPAEVLLRIFHLVAGSRPCNIYSRDNSGKNTSMPRYPDYLSHVCSHWRQIALDLPTLWSHIDLLDLHSLSPGFLSRAETCVARSASLALDVHVRVPSSYDFSYKTEPLLEFLGSVASRVWSFELALPETTDEFEHSILECCFEKFIPGTLTQLTVTNSSGDAPTVVEIAEHEEDVDIDSLWIQASEERAEDLFKLLTVLRLDGLYPRWYSPAYNGLVELRLACSRAPKFQITGWELREVLDLNPNLRVLEFDLDLLERLPEHMGGSSDPPPVRLKDLEVLSIGSLEYGQLQYFISLLDVGSKPLQFTMRYHDRSPLSTRKDKVVKFLKTANITRLWVRGMSEYPTFDELLSLLPRLRVLVLDGIINLPRQLEGSPSLSLSELRQRHSVLHPSYRLDALYMMTSFVTLEYLWKTFEKYPIREFVFWGGNAMNGSTRVEGKDVEDVLSRLCPSVKRTGYDDPRPTAGWE